MQLGANMTTNSVTQQVLTDLKAQGITLVRMLNQEKDIENPANTYTWTSFDTAINLLVANGFQFTIPMMTFQTGNAQNFDGVCNLPTIYAYETWGQKLINRYYPTTGWIALEMGNEEFSDRTMSGACQSGAFYAPIAQAVYPFLKALAPNLLLGMNAQTNWIFSSNAVWLPQFLNQYFSTITGQGPYVDYINMHYYPQMVPPDSPTSLGNANLAQSIGLIKTALSTGGYPNIPIWFTEYGWHRTNMNTTPTTYNPYTDGSTTQNPNGSYNQSIPEGIQANNHIKALNTLQSNGVAYTFLYVFNETYTSYDIAFRQAGQQVGWWLANQKGAI